MGGTTAKRERMSIDVLSEEAQLTVMTTKSGHVLKEIWDNEKDAEYDKV